MYKEVRKNIGLENLNVLNFLLKFYNLIIYYSKLLINIYPWLRAWNFDFLVHSLLMDFQGKDPGKRLVALVTGVNHLLLKLKSNISLPLDEIFMNKNYIVPEFFTKTGKWPDKFTPSYAMLDF